MNDDMTDDETQPTPGDASPPDDARFEVKWRKKSSSGTTGAATPPPVVEDTASLRTQLTEAQEQIRSLQDRWQRAAADLSNLRRRTEQDREQMEQFASMHLVAELLPVLDNFDRALRTIPGNLAMLTWIHGVVLIERHLRALLEARGVQGVEAQGKAFNPSLHEAIDERETDEAPAGQILQVYQTGYTMHGRVIRPALVEVARAPRNAPDSVIASEPETTIAPTETENVGP